MKTIKLQIFIILGLIFNLVSYAGNPSSKNDGDWESNSNWSGGPSPGTTFPTNTTVTVDNYMKLSAEDLTIPSNVNSEIVVNDTLIIDGDLDFNSNSSSFKITVPANGVLIVLGDFDPSGNLSSGFNNFTVNGVVVVEGDMSVGGNGFNINNSSNGEFFVSGTVDPVLSNSKWTNGTADTGEFGELETDHPVLCALTYTCGAVLPIDLLDFEAEKTIDEIEFSWTTLTETNNSHFFIEHSQNGQDFELISDEIQGGNNSNTILEYSKMIKWNNVFNGSFFRLKQVDFDGNTSYSPLLYFKDQIDNNVLIYPTVSTSTITIKVPQDLLDSYAQIISSSSIKLDQFVLEYNEMNYSIEHLSSGIYFIYIDDRSVHKFIVSTDK